MCKCVLMRSIRVACPFSACNLTSVLETQQQAGLGRPSSLRRCEIEMCWTSLQRNAAELPFTQSPAIPDGRSNMARVLRCFSEYQNPLLRPLSSFTLPLCESNHTSYAACTNTMQSGSISMIYEWKPNHIAPRTYLFSRAPGFIGFRKCLGSPVHPPPTRFENL
jgi:hypothetical protein